MINRRGAVEDSLSWAASVRITQDNASKAPWSRCIAAKKKKDVFSVSTERLTAHDKTTR